MGIVEAKRCPRVLLTIPIFFLAKTCSVVLQFKVRLATVVADLLIDVRVCDLDVAEGATTHVG